MDNLQTAFRQRPNRLPVPDEFFCGRPVSDAGIEWPCSGIPLAKADELQMWLDTNRPKLRVNIGKVICQHDRQAREEVAQAERLLDLANFPRRHDDIGPRTWINFTARSRELATAVTALTDFATNPTTHMLTIGGPVGVGKTHMVEAAGRMMVGAGISVRYEFVPQMLRELQDSFGTPGGNAARMALMTDARVLILDDLGQRTEKEWGRGILNELIDQRYRDGSGLLVTTNWAKPELATRVGDRIASRLWDNTTGTARVIQLAETKSYRDRNKAKKGTG